MRYIHGINCGTPVTVIRVRVDETLIGCGRPTARTQCQLVQETRPTSAYNTLQHQEMLWLNNFLFNWNKDIEKKLLFSVFIQGVPSQGVTSKWHQMIGKVDLRASCIIIYFQINNLFTNFNLYTIYLYTHKHLTCVLIFLWHI